MCSGISSLNMWWIIYYVYWHACSTEMWQNFYHWPSIIFEYITMHVHISCESKIPIFMIIVRLSNCVHSVREMKTWIYWSESKSSIYFYKVLRKNWTIYWSEQSFAGLGPEGRCSSWGLALRQAIMQSNIHFL